MFSYPLPIRMRPGGGGRGTGPRIERHRRVADWVAPQVVLTSIRCLRVLFRLPPRFLVRVLWWVPRSRSLRRPVCAPDEVAGGAGPALLFLPPRTSFETSTPLILIDKW